MSYFWTPILIIAVLSQFIVACAASPPPSSSPTPADVVASVNPAAPPVSPAPESETIAIPVEEKLLRYATALGETLPAPAREAAPRISDFSRRLLAVRGYLRSARTLEDKWVWSAAEIERFKSSEQYRQMIAEVDKVKRRFAELNPGYELSANTNVRSFDEQLKNWNDTASIKNAGAALLADSLREVSGAAYGDQPSAGDVARFGRFLQYSRLVQVPTVATPGLSPHGQLRAIDFVVKKGNQLIAGTLSANIRTEWEDGGWERKLNEAVKGASGKFSGPLSAPREPWHYSYVP